MVIGTKKGEMEQPGACRPRWLQSEIEELLWDWGYNHVDRDIKKVVEELCALFGERFAEEKRQQMNSGNE